MPDPFLLAHIVAPLQFDISGPLTPISIRDQMLRGRLIVDRAVEQGLLDPHRDLLVVGAGAAGTTAAIRAAQHGVRAVLLDRATWPFVRQAGCTTRWVDPTQYDFPADHWPQGRYPWRPPAMPLHWRRNFASHLALHWAYQLASAQLRFGSRLDVRCNATLVPPFNPTPTPGGPQLLVRWQEAAGAQQGFFGMLLSAIGFGSEKCQVGTYRGFRFWDADPLGQPSLKMSSGVQTRVLISGGGDGALQDFLRITTRRPARKTYRALRQRLPTVFAGVERRIYNAEDQAMRAYVWGTRQHDCAIHGALHEAHKDVIADLRKSSEWSIIAIALSKLLVDPLPEIKLVHRCNHFSQCYGLNRFLALLIAECMRAQGKDPVHEGNEVTKVTGPSGHTCGNPWHCLGHDHVVEMEEAACKGGAGTKSTQTANLIIVRHGVDPPTYVFSGKPVSNPHPRQVLPYHLVA